MATTLLINAVIEVGDFEAQNCQLARKFDWITELNLAIEPPISYWCCYKLAYSFASFGLCVGLWGLQMCMTV